MKTIIENLVKNNQNIKVKDFNRLVKSLKSCKGMSLEQLQSLRRKTTNYNIYRGLSVVLGYVEI